MYMDEVDMIFEDLAELGVYPELIDGDNGQPRFVLTVEDLLVIIDSIQLVP